MVNSALSNGFKEASTFLSSHSTAIQSVVTVGAVAGINQIIEVAAFKCPCIMEAELNLTCESYQSSFCPTRDKAMYSYLFAFGPAVILLLIGFMVNVKFWKKITGLYHSTASENKLQVFVCSFLSSFGFALIAPLSWIVFSLIDGEFFACAVTTLPYYFGPGQECQNTTNVSTADCCFAMKLQ